MTPGRSTVDVAALPTTVFGPRALLWWGTLSFMAIEGTTLFVCVAAYLYLWRNFPTWPPEHTLRPSLLWPTISLAVILVSNIPLMLADKAARRLDLPALRRWMVVALVLGFAFLFLRWQDLLALNCRWDTNAYGSIAWITVGMHASLLVFNALETLVFVAILFSRRVEERYFSDASESCFYWYFMTLAWVPLYITVYLTPYLS
jgi:heme/copper-type cytochrome/quinol oxidase subunit 3